MKYLLDTNVCIRFINGRSPQLRQRLLTLEALEPEIVVSTITKAELYFGSAKSQTPDSSRIKQDSFLKRFRFLPFDELAAEYYGPMRAALERAGTPIGQNDMLIAAIVLAHKLILVTHNTREFERVAGLPLEDWEL